MEIKMKNISNMAAICGFMLVVVSFILNAMEIIKIDMVDALKTGAFMKGFFLPVDASIWLNKAFGNK